MELTEIIDRLSEERFFKGPDSKNYSSFLKNPSRRQLDYFIDNLNESCFNMKTMCGSVSHFTETNRSHQKIIALSCLVSAPLLVSSKGDYISILSSNHCDFKKNLENYIKENGPYIELDRHKYEQINILKNVSSIFRIKPSSPQKKQIRILSSCNDPMISETYKTMIAPMLGYKDLF